MKSINFKKILTIFRHELSYMLRDKTTLLMMILLPIIVYPLLSVVSAYMVMESAVTVRKQATVVSIFPKNPEIAEALKEHYGKAKINLSVNNYALNTAEVKAGIYSGTLSVYIEVAPDFEKKIAAGETSDIMLKYDGTNDRSMAAISEVISALKKYKLKIIENNIEKNKINESLIFPFDIDETNLATPAQIGDSFLAKILPMLIIMFATLGSFYPAIDVTAMEKERGTLETLLLAPVTGFDIMAGKFLAVFTLTMLSVLINLFSMALTLTHGFLLIKKIVEYKMISAISISISAYSMFAIFIFMIPMACIMSSIMMQVAIFARNFKEAQNYMTPILFFFMIPPMVGALPGYDLNFHTALVPVVNLTLLFKAMLKGDYQFQYLVITFAVNFFFSLVALYFAAKTFSSESVLFRPSEDLETLYFWRFKELKINQETAIFFVFFVVQMISLYFLGSFFQTFFSLRSGLVLTEVLLILVPSYILIKLVYGDFLGHIKFRMVPAAEFGYAALVGMSGFGFTFVITILLGLIIPPPDDFLKGMQDFVVAKSVYDFFVIAVLAAVLPGVCEEVMFRGALLRPLYKKYGRVTSAVYCGLLFGVFHLSVYRFLPTAFIGFYLSLITIHTGSIIPAMFCHFLNNFMIVALTNAGNFFKGYGSTAAETGLLVIVFMAFLVFPFVIRPMLEDKKSGGPIQKP